MSSPQTWHYGLIAEWWAEFNTDGPEIDYFGRFVERGQPALDAGCGTGRLLLPWLRAGFDVDGCDVSAPMISLCRSLARREGFDPALFVQPLHALDPPRRYRTIVVCGVFGLGSTRAQDQEALHRFRRCLEVGGTLVLDNETPYANAGLWRSWTRDERRRLPAPWPPQGEGVARPTAASSTFGLGPSTSIRSTRQSCSRFTPRSGGTVAWSLRKNARFRCECTSATNCSLCSTVPASPASTRAADTPARTRPATMTSWSTSPEHEMSTPVRDRGS